MADYLADRLGIKGWTPSSSERTKEITPAKAKPTKDTTYPRRESFTLGDMEVTIGNGNITLDPYNAAKIDLTQNEFEIIIDFIKEVGVQFGFTPNLCAGC